MNISVARFALLAQQSRGHDLLSRRKFLSSGALGGLAVSVPIWARTKRASLAEVLNALPSIGSGTQFVKRFGQPFSRNRFTLGDLGQRKAWNQTDIGFPRGVIDTLPVGTICMLYYFRQGTYVMHPLRGEFELLVDDNDHIVGWTYSRVLAGDEKESRLIDLW